MAKIVYTHTKQDSSYWWCCPPSLEGLTVKQERLLEDIWHKCGNTYIVDPLGHTQCLYIMLREIPFGKLISKFIKKEHKYEV